MMSRMLACLAFLAAAPAAAQVLDQKAAREALFSTRGYDLQVSGALSEADIRTVRALVPLMAEQLRQPIRYYATIAYSPGDGLVHEALQAALNHHSVRAADAAALAACNARRSSGTEPCRPAARVVPRRFAPGAPLTLSVDATIAFNDTYRRMRGSKSLAVSPGTGGWGVGASDAEALEACARIAGDGKECEIVIRDER